MNILQSALENRCLVAPVTAWLLSQLLKFLLAACRTGRFSRERLWGSGGMPSAHGATVSALAVSSALTYGVGGDTFALAAVFALVVMYDACGVRLEAGRHAKMLNEIARRADAKGQPLQPDGKFHELVGHTLSQVLAGAALGILVAVVICRVLPPWQGRV